MITNKIENEKFVPKEEQKWYSRKLLRGHMKGLIGLFRQCTREQKVPYSKLGIPNTKCLGRGCPQFFSILKTGIVGFYIIRFEKRKRKKEKVQGANSEK